MTATAQKQQHDKQHDKKLLTGIVREMADSMTGAQSTKHWANDALWFDIPAFASKCSGLLNFGSGASCGLQRQQPFVTRWRPTRLHGGAPPALEDTKLRRAGFTLPIPRCSALDPVTRIDRDARGRHGLRRVKHIACESSSARRDRFACAINPAGPHRDAPPIPPGRAWLRGNAPVPKDRDPVRRAGAKRRAF